MKLPEVFHFLEVIEFMYSMNFSCVIWFLRSAMERKNCLASSLLSWKATASLAKLSSSITFSVRLLYLRKIL